MQIYNVLDTARLSGANAQTIRGYVAQGIIRPAKPARNKRDGHWFSLSQVLALASGVMHREQGAPGERVRGVVKFLSTLTQEKLEANLADGKTFPVPASLVHQAAREEGVPAGFWLPGALMKPEEIITPDMAPASRALLKKLDIKPLWEDVKRKAAALEKRPAPKKEKRKRRSTR